MAAFKSALSPVDAGNLPLLSTHADSRCLFWQRRKMELRGNQLVFVKERNRLLILLRRLLRLGRGSKTQNFICLNTRHIAISFPANRLAVFEDHILQEALKAALRESHPEGETLASPSVIKPSRLQVEVDQWLKTRYDASDPINRCWVVFATLAERNEWECIINDHVAKMRSDKLSRTSTEDDDASTIEEELQDDDPLMSFYTETRKNEKVTYELKRAETKHFKIGRRFRLRPRSNSCYAAKNVTTKRDSLEENFSFIRQFVQSKESISPTSLPSHFTFN